jgi:hypothetical protein
MSLATIMLDQLAVARRVIADGHEMIPAWRIGTPEGAFLILARFDPDKPGQRERSMYLIARLMVWKMATSFVLAAETWLGAEATRSGDEALLTVGVPASSAGGAATDPARRRCRLQQTYVARTAPSISSTTQCCRQARLRSPAMRPESWRASSARMASCWLNG